MSLDNSEISPESEINSLNVSSYFNSKDKKFQFKELLQNLSWEVEGEKHVGAFNFFPHPCMECMENLGGNFR